MTLDLLHEVREHGTFLLVSQLQCGNTTNSEVNVYFLALREQTDGLSSCHRCLSLSAYLICVYVFVCVFVFILTFNRHWHTTIHRSPRADIGAFAAKQDTFVDFLSKPTGWLPCLQLGF